MICLLGLKNNVVFAYHLPIKQKALKVLTINDLKKHNKVLQLHYVENAKTQKDLDLLNVKINGIQTQNNFSGLKEREGFATQPYIDTNQYSAGYGSGFLARYLQGSLGNDGEGRQILKRVQKYQDYFNKLGYKVLPNEKQKNITEAEANNWLLLIDLPHYYNKTYSFFASVLIEYYFEYQDYNEDKVIEKTLHTLSNHPIFDYNAQISNMLVIFNNGIGNYQLLCQNAYKHYLQTPKEKRKVDNIKKCILAQNKNHPRIFTHRQQDAMYLTAK